MLPSEVLKKIENVLIEYLEKGTLKQACENNGISLTTFFKYRKQYPLVEQAYSIARMSRADMLAEEIVSIADKQENPHKARIMIDSRKWVCSVFNRPVYGDKVDVTIEKRVDLNSALAQAKTRTLRHMGDIEQIEETQAIDINNDIPGNSTDNESADSLEDIFEGMPPE